MNNTHVLILLCLLSLVLTGFASALVLFGRYHGDPGQKIRVVNLLALGLMSGLFCLMPLVIGAARVPEGTAFRISQFVLAASVSFLVAVRFIPSFRLNRSRISELALFFLSIGLLLGTAILQVVSAVDERSAVPYYMVGVATLVLVTGITFYRVVNFAMRHPEA
jgi:hypothetical protein